MRPLRCWNWIVPYKIFNVVKPLFSEGIFKFGRSCIWQCWTSWWWLRTWNLLSVKLFWNHCGETPANSWKVFQDYYQYFLKSMNNWQLLHVVKKLFPFLWWQMIFTKKRASLLKISGNHVVPINRMWNGRVLNFFFQQTVLLNGRKCWKSW